VTSDLDRLLRDAVHELAAEGRPVDLTASALRRARHIRARRFVAAAASVVVLLAGLGFAAVRYSGVDRSAPPPADRSPSVVISDPAEPAPTATEPTEVESLPPGSAPLALPGGWLIRAAPGPVGAIIYDDGQGRYRLAGSAQRVAPAPNGRFLAEVTNNHEVVIRRFADDQEVNRRANAISDEDVYPVWAPDSSHVALLVPVGTATKLLVMSVTGTETLSTQTVPCNDGCTVKWLSNSQAVRLYTARDKVEMNLATGTVGALSATPEDPCGYQRTGYQISNPTWLCVTPTGFAVTYPDGTVTERVPFPTTIEGIGVSANINGYVLFRPK
jgi:hypothetical protein